MPYLILEAKNRDPKFSVRQHFSVERETKNENKFEPSEKDQILPTIHANQVHFGAKQVLFKYRNRKATRQTERPQLTTLFQEDVSKVKVCSDVAEYFVKCKTDLVSKFLNLGRTSTFVIAES